MRQPECHEEDSSGLTTPSLIKLTQVERMCNFRNRASLSPSQGEKRKSGSLAGSGTQCHCWKHRRTPAQVALHYQLQRGVVALAKSFSEKRIKENFQVPVGLWAARGWQRHIVCPLGWVVWEVPNVYLGRVYLPKFSMGIFAVFNSPVLQTYKTGSTVFGKNSLQRVWVKFKSQPSFLLHSMAVNKSSLDFFSWKKWRSLWRWDLGSEISTIPWLSPQSPKVSEGDLNHQPQLSEWTNFCDFCQGWTPGSWKLHKFLHKCVCLYLHAGDV